MAGVYFTRNGRRLSHQLFKANGAALTAGALPLSTFPSRPTVLRAALSLKADAHPPELVGMTI